MLEANDSNERLPQTRKKYSTKKRSRYGPRERKMIIGIREAIMNIFRRGSIDEDVVYCLDVERLLNFGVRGDEQVSEWNSDEKTCQNDI